MTARAAVIVLALALNPAQLYAQDTVFTVNVSSADVHQGPSIATPVIGHVAVGTAMPVLRNLGSWVKVDWPAAPDGFAYLHMTTGRLTARNGDASTSNSKRAYPNGAATASSSTTSSAAAATRAPVSASASTGTQPAKLPHRSHERVVIRSQQDSTAISHVVGVGGLFGSMSSFGATSRVWRDDRLGVQFAFTRDAMTSSTAAGRVTSMQLEPAVVYGLFDHVSDYFWIRPYVGGGVSIRHQNLQDVAPAPAETTSTGVGVRVFGGGEFTFAGAPRFALSADAGYRTSPTPFPGFEPSHFTVSLSGHWYVK
jgi:hypothetical protein